MACLNFAFMGGLVVTPLLMQQIFKYSNTRAACVLFLRPFSYSLCAAMAGRVHGLVRDRALAVGGSATVAVSMLLFALGAQNRSLPMVVLALISCGVGMAIVSPPMAATVANVADPADYGIVSGMRGTIGQVGVTAGVQTMAVTLGTTYTPDGFAASFHLGGAVALAGLAMACFVRLGARPPARP